MKGEKTKIKIRGTERGIHVGRQPSGRGPHGRQHGKEQRGEEEEREEEKWRKGERRGGEMETGRERDNETSPWKWTPLDCTDSEPTAVLHT